MRTLNLPNLYHRLKFPIIPSSLQNLVAAETSASPYIKRSFQGKTNSDMSLLEAAKKAAAYEAVDKCVQVC